VNPVVTYGLVNGGRRWLSANGALSGIVSVAYESAA